MKDPPHATNKAVKGHKASVSTASATAKESLLVEGIENIGVKEKVDIPDDGRPLLVSLKSVCLNLFPVRWSFARSGYLSLSRSMNTNSHNQSG